MTYIVHGEPPAQAALKARIERELGWPVHVPEYLEQVRAVSAPDDRPYLLERVDEAAVVQLYADGFTELAPREKTLIYHLSRAALAGRDIYYDQRYAPSLDMRGVVEAVLTHPANVEPDTLARVHHYAKLFWLNSGPHNSQTARKFLLRCEPEAFAAAVRAAANDGARLPTEARRDARRPAREACAVLLRSRVRRQRHQQDAGRGARHPRDEREQPLRRRQPRRPRGLPRAVPAQLAPREA